jgi:hypothetical protein
MVSQKTLEAFESSVPFVDYIVGLRMRRQKEVNLSVLGNQDPQDPWFGLTS